MTSIDLIIFDCDGVLVDSEIIAAQVEARLLSDSGYAIDAHTLSERFAGLTWKDILLTVEREASLPLQASLLDKSEKILDEKLARDVRAIEGVARAVSRIALPRCICSNSSSRRLESMLRRAQLYDVFAPNIFSAKDLPDGHPKPAPDIFLHAAKAMGADPARVIVVEDSVHGVRGAKAAGMRVVGFTGGAHSWPAHADHLTEAGAETVISCMRDLPPMVEALAAWSEAV
jgi:beta-phosphoglucomutase-like phosphatase (HAD superfamily)